MQDPNIQGQLWNAGNVRHLARSHKRGADTAAAPKRCAYVDAKGVRCTNSARRVQAAKYCDDHARCRNYELNKAPVETRTCPCGRTFTYKKTPRTAMARTWDEFCPSCHNETPLTLVQLRQHNVPEILIRQWLKAGSKVKCDVCERTLARRHIGSRPVIDHDHTCCRGGNSCGQCVRGLLCRDCNTKIGHLETALSADLFHRLLDYIERKPLQR